MKNDLDKEDDRIISEIEKLNGISLPSIFGDVKERFVVNTKSFGYVAHKKRVVGLGLKYIKKLPDDFCKLKKLKALWLEENHELTAIPDNFGELKSLKVLLMFWNSNINSYPDSLTKLKKLKFMRLDRKPLENSSKKVQQWYEHLHEKKPDSFFV